MTCKAKRIVERTKAVGDPLYGKTIAQFIESETGLIDSRVLASRKYAMFRIMFLFDDDSLLWLTCTEGQYAYGSSPVDGWGGYMTLLLWLYWEDPFDDVYGVDVMDMLSGTYYDVEE